MLAEMCDAMVAPEPDDDASALCIKPVLLVSVVLPLSVNVVGSEIPVITL